MALINLIVTTRSTTKKDSSRKLVAKSQYVNEVKPIGQVKPLERRIISETKKSTSLEVKTSKDNMLIVTAMLTKFPHYEFVAKVKSGELGLIKYWFKDTTNNITHVYSAQDMQDLLHRSFTRDVDLKTIGSEEKDTVDIPDYSLFDNVPISYRNLLKIKYRLYKLSKYNNLEPFYTKFIALKDKKVQEVKEYDKPTKNEEVEEKIEVPKILGSNGTGLQIVNGFIVSVKNV